MADDIRTLTELEKGTGPGEVLFLSRYTNLRLVREAGIEEVLTGGIRRMVRQPVRIRFEQGLYRARVGRKVMVDHEGWLARDEPFDIERDEVDALRAHRRFNKDFYEVGKEPGRLQPYDETVLEWMSDAVADLDVERLAQLLEDEKNTHNRPLLVRALSSALTKTRETRVKIEAAANDQQAAEAEKAKPAKAKPAPKAAE